MTESKKVTLTTPEGFVASQLTDTIWSIDDGMVRCFLVVGSDAALLIDSGVTRGSALSHLVSSLTNKPVTLVFTHTDGDHTGGQEFFGTPLLHPAEYDYYVTIDHEMTKEHYISFVAYVGWDRVLLVKLYPEWKAEARFPRMQGRRILAYCNKHGLWEERS